MAEKHLGPVFDIHGGGIDLVFPHHENEIAQSRCAHGTPVMARTWLHNGFLQVEGEKMSKSLGNFITIHELLDEKKFGGNQWHGLVVRLAMLGTHYRQPIDWTADRLVQARATLMDFAELLHDVEPAAEPHRRRDRMRFPTISTRRARSPSFTGWRSRHAAIPRSPDSSRRRSRSWGSTRTRPATSSMSAPKA